MTPDAGRVARCETHGHIYGYAGDRIRACIFCGTLRKSSLDTPPPPEPEGELIEALKEIAKGEGAFSRDPLKHAENTIENMKAIATAALARARGKG